MLKERWKETAEAEGRKMGNIRERDLFSPRCFRRSGMQMMRCMHSFQGNFQ